MPYKNKDKQNEYQCIRRKKKKEYYGGWNKALNIEKLGTTDFSEHLAIKENGEPDWDKELNEINEEYIRLRLKRKL